MICKKIFILSVMCNVSLTSIYGKFVHNGENKESLNSINSTDTKVLLRSSNTSKNINNNNSTGRKIKSKTFTPEQPGKGCTKEVTNSLQNEDNLKDCFKGADNLTALILTTYIENGQIKEARDASRVNPEMFLGVESYSGYFTVNKTYNSNTFFWYFPVQNKPVNETPWIIWLQGGPGATSMTGLFDEIGPFKLDLKFNLKRNHYSWLQNHSLLFFDNPVGTGFSYTENIKGYAQDMATYSSHLYTAFRQFIQVFPELRTAPLYIAGESYAGKFIPALGSEIHKHIKLPKGKVNLQGFIFGNAFVDPPVILQLTRPFYNFGLIDQDQLHSMKPIMDVLAREVADKNSVAAKNTWMTLVNRLLLMTQQSHGYNFLLNDIIVGRHVVFLNKPDVQRAIHVRRTNMNFVNMTVNAHLSLDFLTSSKSIFENLLDHYKVLAYCGQLDLMMPCVIASENYRTWRWSKASEFSVARRLPYFYKRKRAGFYKSGGGFTEVMFIGAGHMVPLDAPAPSQDLITRWTHNMELGKRVIFVNSTQIQHHTKHKSI